MVSSLDTLQSLSLWYKEALLFSDIHFTDISAYMFIPEGSYNATLVVKTTDQMTMGTNFNVSFDVVGNNTYTLLVTGSLDSPTLTTVQDMPPTATGGMQIRLVNLGNDTASLLGADGQPLISNIAPGQSSPFTMASGSSSDWRIRIGQNSTIVILGNFTGESASVFVFPPGSAAQRQSTEGMTATAPTEAGTQQAAGTQAGTERQGTGTEQLATGTEQAAGTQASGTEQQATGAQQGTQQQATGTEQQASGTEQQATGTEQQPTGTQQATSEALAEDAGIAFFSDDQIPTATTKLRGLHAWLGNEGVLNLWIDGRSFAMDLSYTNVSDYMEFEPGLHMIRVRMQGGTMGTETATGTETGMGATETGTETGAAGTQTGAAAQATNAATAGTGAAAGTQTGAAGTETGMGATETGTESEASAQGTNTASAGTAMGTSSEELALTAEVLEMWFVIGPNMSATIAKIVPSSNNFPLYFYLENSPTPKDVYPFWIFVESVATNQSALRVINVSPTFQTVTVNFGGIVLTANYLQNNNYTQVSTGQLAFTVSAPGLSGANVLTASGTLMISSAEHNFTTIWILDSEDRETVLPIQTVDSPVDPGWFYIYAVSTYQYYYPQWWYFRFQLGYQYYYRNVYNPYRYRWYVYYFYNNPVRYYYYGYYYSAYVTGRTSRGYSIPYLSLRGYYKGSYQRISSYAYGQRYYVYYRVY
jgi:hypothetical protein